MGVDRWVSNGCAPASSLVPKRCTYKPMHRMLCNHGHKIPVVIVAAAHTPEPIIHGNVKGLLALCYSDSDGDPGNWLMMPVLPVRG